MPHIVIVQDVPTQFDVPLYNRIAREQPFGLTVIYTQTHRAGGGFDPEIGRAPAWDHILGDEYERIDLDAAQAGNVAGVASLIAARNPGHVILSGYYPRLHRQLVKPLRRLGISIGLRSDNTLQHSNFAGVKGVAKKLILPIWLRRYDCWHPVGSLAHEYLKSLAGVDKPCFLFPYNVDNQWLAEAARKARNNRESELAALGFPADSIVILGIMKWHEREDPLTLIDAFCHYSASQPRARLILVGDGPLKTTITHRLRGFEHLVHRPGYVTYSALPGFYGLADIFVHPAKSEPWGVSVNEALACAVPVIASTAVGAAQDLIDDTTGMIFPRGDGVALAECMNVLAGRLHSGNFAETCSAKIAAWSYDESIATFARMMRQPKEPGQ